MIILGCPTTNTVLVRNIHRTCKSSHPPIESNYEYLLLAAITCFGPDTKQVDLGLTRHGQVNCGFSVEFFLVVRHRSVWWRGGPLATTLAKFCRFLGILVHQQGELMTCTSDDECTNQQLPRASRDEASISTAACMRAVRRYLLSPSALPPRHDV